MLLKRPSPLLDEAASDRNESIPYEIGSTRLPIGSTPTGVALSNLRLATFSRMRPELVVPDFYSNSSALIWNIAGAIKTVGRLKNTSPLGRNCIMSILRCTS